MLLDEGAGAHARLSISGDSVKSMPGLLLLAESNQLPAVDHDGRAGDEAPRVGGEQQKRAVEVALLAEAADRDLARHAAPGPVVRYSRLISVTT